MAISMKKLSIKTSGVPMAQPRKKRRWLVIIIILAILYLLIARLLPQGGPGGWGMMGGAAPVSVAEVMQRSVRQWHDVSGRITAIDQADVRPRISGVIQQVKMTEGALVNEGDVLFVIDPRPYTAAVTGAEGQLGQAQAQLSFAKSDMGRAQILIKDKAIPQHQFDQNRNALNVAEASVKSAQAALDVAKLNYDYAYVKAPITGRVSRAEITAGNLVEGGGNAPVLTTIVASGQVYADFEIDEATFMPYAQAGLAEGSNEAVKSIPVALALTGETGFPHEGHLQSFDNRINLGSGTIRARGIFNNDNSQLLTGMFAHIRMGSPTEKPVLLITERAIGTDQSKKFVLVVGQDNKAMHREITTGGITDDGMRIVESGLSVGEKIIVSGLQRIRMPGQAVTPELVAMDYKEPPPAMPGAPPAKGKPTAEPAKK